MLRRAIDTTKAKQPIATTGIFSHSYYWLTASSGDQSYLNPSCRPEQNQGEEGTAIYFIHGTGDCCAAFKRVAERLIQAGLPARVASLNLLSFDQRYQGKSIENFAEQLRDKILCNSHQRVMLIAHSRGGLVASYFTEFLAPPAAIEVSMVINVGTPFNGSYLAVKPLSWLSASVSQMEIESDFLVRLKLKILEKANSEYHFVIATEDSVVPGESGYIKEYVDQYPDSLCILDRHGHLSVMSSHRLVSYILNLLDTYFKPVRAFFEESVVTKYRDFTLIEDYLPDTAETRLS